MSHTLCCRPKVNKRKTLPGALKIILLKNQSVGYTPGTFATHDLCYLRGLADAEVEGAQELIKLIEKHGEVELWLE